MRAAADSEALGRDARTAERAEIEQVIEEGKRMGQIKICVLKGGKGTTILLGPQARAKQAANIVPDLQSFSSVDNGGSGASSKEGSEASQQGSVVPSQGERLKTAQGKRVRRGGEGGRGTDRGEIQVNESRESEQPAGSDGAEETDHGQMIQLAPSSLRKVRGAGGLHDQLQQNGRGLQGGGGGGGGGEGGARYDRKRQTDSPGGPEGLARGGDSSEECEGEGGRGCQGRSFNGQRRPLSGRAHETSNLRCPRSCRAGLQLDIGCLQLGLTTWSSGALALGAESAPVCRCCSSDSSQGEWGEAKVGEEGEGGGEDTTWKGRRRKKREREGGTVIVRQEGYLWKKGKSFRMWQRRYYIVRYSSIFYYKTEKKYTMVDEPR
eukprot:768405-Hanusia_phi.AAC.1